MPKIRFTRGKHYKGQLFAAGDVAEVDPVWARAFVERGAAVPVPEEPAAAPPASPVDVQTPEPPAVAHRDPVPSKRRRR